MADPKTDLSGQIVQPRMITHLGDGATPLTNRDVALDLKVLTDLVKGATNSDSIAVETANVLKAASHLLAFDGTAWRRVQVQSSGNLFAALRDGGNVAAVFDGADGNTNNRGLLVHASPRTFNGTSWDRLYGNREVLSLASALRAAGTTTPNLTTYNARTLVGEMDITARTVAASPSITVTLQAQNPGDSQMRNLMSATFNPTVALHRFYYGPGIAAIVTGAVGGVLQALWAGPMFRTLRFNIAYVADVTDLTYSFSEHLGA